MFGCKNRGLVRLWRFALPPGSPFNRLDFQRHAQINVDPFVLVGMPAGKRHGGDGAVFGDPQFKILIIGGRRGRAPTGEVMVPKRGVKRPISFMDNANYIRNQMLSEFLKPLYLHLTQPLTATPRHFMPPTNASASPSHGDPANWPKYGERDGRPRSRADLTVLLPGDDYDLAGQTKPTYEKESLSRIVPGAGFGSNMLKAFGSRLRS
jgi:hypothetical protein